MLSYMSNLRNDYRWGHLSLIGQYQSPLYKTDREGNRYVYDTHGGPFMWRLRCACGYEWEIPREEFPGRRVLRSCGRKECTVTAKPVKSPKEPKVSVCLYLPVDLLNQLRTYQIRSGTSQSKAAITLLYKALADALVEDER